MLLNVVNLKTSMPAMSSPWPTCGLVEGFMQPSLGCGCSMSSYILTTCPSLALNFLFKSHLWSG